VSRDVEKALAGWLARGYVRIGEIVAPAREVVKKAERAA